MVPPHGLQVKPFFKGFASPNLETEAMKDGSDAVSDWPLLNAILNVVVGRDLGIAEPWRRRWHGIFTTLGYGHLL